ncbi:MULTISPECIES: CocE/NonD family hydrolase [Streptomyces]|uniref:CocE/NonD family hydrolase n=1 Tax=Streptomyces TaxID=1883 RepID=UPI00103A25F4|nr:MULTISPECIES: CocE/NonD family hydrolase [Streptomyces]MBT3072972.1 CocE/NonD family hydrolase [Streptomyces sp. COG21]MBT3094943.1 CocE/NonD family hydrolase [Streptomyces sp. CBG30]MBT3102966.1 CocE/NonD family hydrolase [Streptomyces sp. COG19]MDI7789445.1 CocE/NonD family hydrolase [Streptomyces cavourensis]
MRSPLVALAAAALAAPLVLAGPAHAEPAPYTVTPLKFTVQAGGRSCTVDADLYRPAGVDADRPAPAVLATNGFGGSKSDGSTDAIGRAVAARGYVGLVYSGLGFGKSGCLITLDDPAIDGKAASGLLDFLGGTRAADDGTRADYVVQDGEGDPRVGMIGGSYGGAIQLATASVDPRLDALVPLITWNDLAYALAPNNTGARTGVTSDTPGVFKWQWTNGFYLIGEGQPLLNPSLDPSRFNRLDCLHFAAQACETIRLLNSGRYPADKADAMLAYARSVSPVSYLDRVKAPTLIVQGQADSLFNLNEATATYQTLKAQGTPAKMIWQSWGHSGGQVPGELDLSDGNLESSYVGQRVLAWFDRYLQKETETDTGPEFAYYRSWQSGYGTADRLPALSQQLYLSGDGKLVDNRSKVVRGSRQYTNWLVPTSHSESSIAPLIGLPDPKPYDTKGTYLGWRSAPLTAPLDVVGAPKATLKVVSPKAERVQNSGDASDKLVLFAKVYDVAPDGTRTLVNRLVSPVRVPDVTRPFTVELPGIVHRYEKGHRLEFVIAASDTAYFGNRGIKPVTVVSAPEDTGVLELPVVPAG